MATVPTPPDDAAFAERRAYPRAEVALPALLQVASERYAVQLLDLSAGGAKLDCPAPVAVGAAVTLDCGTLARTAVVRWLNGNLVGICFDSELEGREISALIDRSNALTAWRKTRA
jgi:hypothetical protein